ncbi:hypothetical protein [Rufibacter tibetensis]|nr:hypothetical protein [Rufibacter tibetensis]
MDYTPATDILYVEYPDLDSALLPVIKNSFTILVEAIVNYDVKRLLLDASRTHVSISEEENRDISIQLATALAKTRLQKVARIQPLDPVLENKAQNNISRIHQKGVLTYELRTFSSNQEAVKWLQS